MSTPSQSPQKNTKLNVLYTDNNEGTVKSTCLIPPGTIVMWVGSEVPYGWTLCNGQNGTPNLIDKFIKGGKPKPLIPSSSPTQTSISGYVGGNKMITLTENNLPPHKHSLYFSESSTEPDHTHTNITTPEEKIRTTVKHKHNYNANKETVAVDDSDVSSSSTSEDMFKSTTNSNTSSNSHFHNLTTSSEQSHNHTCNIKFNSRSIPPSSPSSSPSPSSSVPPSSPSSSVPPSPSPSPSPSSLPSPSSSVSPSPFPSSSTNPRNFVYVPKPPHTNLIPSISSQGVFSPQPIYIEPSYYVLAFIMKL